MNDVTHYHIPSPGIGQRGRQDTMLDGALPPVAVPPQARPENSPQVVSQESHMSSKNLSLFFYWPNTPSGPTSGKVRWGHVTRTEVERGGCPRTHMQPQSTACWGFHCLPQPLLPAALISEWELLPWCSENRCKAARLPQVGPAEG